MKNLIPLCSALALAGCATVAPLPPAPVAPPPSAAGAPPPPAAIGFEGNYVSVRDYLLRSEPLQFDRTQAFVILDDDDRGRNMKICRAFERLVSAEDAAQIMPEHVPVETHWMLNATQVPSGDLDAKCGAMIDQFDRTRANALLTKYGLERSTAYLLALDGQDRAFYLDIDSGSQAQLDAAMAEWFSAAAKSPDSEGEKLQDIATQIASRLCATSVLNWLPNWAGQVIGLIWRDGECQAPATARQT